MCGEVCYELSPAQGWAGGKALNEKEAAELMRRVAANANTLYWEALEVAVDHLRGVEWSNRVGRKARDVCKVADM